jgi:hypothetical protein
MIACFLFRAFGRKEKKKNEQGSDKDQQCAANDRKKSILNGIVHGSVCSPGVIYFAAVCVKAVYS